MLTRTRKRRHMDIAGGTIYKWWKQQLQQLGVMDFHTRTHAVSPVFTRVLSDGSGVQNFGAKRLADVVERTHPALLPLSAVELQRLGKLVAMPLLRDRVQAALSNLSDPITLDEPPQAPVFRHTCSNGLVMGFDARALCAYMRASGSFTNPVNTSETFSRLDVWCIGELARDPELARDIEMLRAQKQEADERRSVLEFLERDAGTAMQRLLDEAIAEAGGGASVVLRRILDVRAPDVYECLNQVRLSFSVAQARDVCAALVDQTRAAQHEPYAHYEWVFEVAHEVLKSWRRMSA